MVVGYVRRTWRKIAERRALALQLLLAQEGQEKPKSAPKATWRVTSTVWDITTTPELLLGPQDDDVDPNTNEIYADCETAWDIEDRFEAFWNRIDLHAEKEWPHTHRGEQKVKVLAVRRLT